MKQYCRYCTHACYCDYGIWCSKLEKSIAESTAKSTNNCKSFDFNPIDVFAPDYDGEPHLYQPKENKIDKNQISMFDQSEELTNDTTKLIQ